MPGVVRTRVGYAGGTKRNPTYRDLGDHTETVQIDYDPEKISFDELLEVFWKEHSPAEQSWSRQYAAVIFYHNDGQKRKAEDSKDRLSEKTGRPVRTEILPYTGFTMAEDYHQKHALQRYPEFLEELEAVYPSMQELVASTAASRLNGYAGGDGTCETLQAELYSLGLSSKARDSLWKIVCTARGVRLSCPLPERN